MFAPLDGVPEDPATGSANYALVGLFAHYENADTDVAEWQIAQGIEMGRPSVLTARSEKKGGGSDRNLDRRRLCDSESKRALHRAEMR